MGWEGDGPKQKRIREGWDSGCPTGCVRPVRMNSISSKLVPVAGGTPEASPLTDDGRRATGVRLQGLIGLRRVWENEHSRPETSEPLWMSFAGALCMVGVLVAVWVVL